MTRNSRRVVALAFAGAVAIAPVISGCGAGSEPQSAAPTQLTEGVNVSLPQGGKTAQIDVRNMFLLGPKADQKLPAGASVPLYATIINQVKGRPDRLVSATAAADFPQTKITGGAVTLPAAKESGEGTATTLVGQAAAPAPPATTKPAKPGEKPSGKPSETPGANPSETPGANPSETPGAKPSATPETTTASPESTAATPTPPATTPPPTDAIPAGKAPLVVLTGASRELLGGEVVKLKLQFEHAGTVEVSVPVVVQHNEYLSYAAVSAGVPAPVVPAQTGKPEGEHGGGHETPAPGGHESPAPTGGHATTPASTGHETNGPASPAATEKPAQDQEHSGN
ncbi:hypothetical protein [Spirillospora sp. CA-294931]|uniref:hypothetical protein n=1 Tax=Spirillospora sp. CA-294931 TaxID=3240042 RepID=UPI003D93F48F